MSTTTAAPPRLSIDEFLARYADLPGAELVNGVVKEPTVTFPRHGKICLRIGGLILAHVEAHDLGHVMSNDSRVRVSADSVRGGDVIYFSYERLPKGAVPEGLLPVAPDLVVEVKSPSDRWGELFVKVGEYIQAGVRAVVVLDPATESATVYRPVELQQIFHNGDDLTLPDVLPGFAVPVARLFA